LLDTKDLDQTNISVDSTPEYFQTISHPEIFIGLVSPLGTDLERVEIEIKAQLKELGYKSHTVRLSEGVSHISSYKKDLVEEPEEERIRSYMDAAKLLRNKMGGGVLAHISTLRIRAIRKSITGNSQAAPEKVAYILCSIKTVDEVNALRNIYGKNFFLVSAYSHKDKRIKSLHKKLENDKNNIQSKQLINRDYLENSKEGQNVSGVFPLADFFVNAESKDLESNVTRFFELMFGNNFLTPKIDEMGIFLASSVALRSADLARQVGAAVLTKEGEILSIGCNEAPKCGGGLYWEFDKGDKKRDFDRGVDSNDEIKNKIKSEFVTQLTDDLICKLSDKKVFTEEIDEVDKIELVSELLISDTVKKSKFSDVIEFGRSVHAEMAAISDAAKRGISLADSTLYCTTFPCHICTRHIVAAGISRVVYVEPYIKSKAAYLYSDSISVDGKTSKDKVAFQAFMGIAPRLYQHFFKIVNNRKDKKTGKVIEWDESKSSFRFKVYDARYISAEQYVADKLLKTLENKKLVKVDSK